MARSFNGSTDHINCGGGVGNPTSVSMACWVNAPLPPGNVFLMYRDAAGYHLQGCYLNSFGQFGVNVAAASGLSQVAPPSGSITPNAWTHLGFSYDSTNGILAYINGVQDPTTGSALGAALSLSTATFGLGYEPTTSTNFYGGLLYDAAIWGVALSAGDFSQLSRGGRPASTIGWWPLGGTASPEPDMSGFGNNGVLTGTGFAPDPIFPVPSISNLITIP